MTALVLPGVDAAVWHRRTKGDPAGVALADRHYSRVLYGRKGGQLGPPGRLLVFVTPCERAVWVTHWPDPAMALDGLDAWRCTMFRNEGAGLSSDLIIAAMALTAQLWPGRPADGWLTWVDADAVTSTNPGYCFQRAGWIWDRNWTGGKGRRMRRYRATVPP